jgi:hypothetical protein
MTMEKAAELLDSAMETVGPTSLSRAGAEDHVRNLLLARLVLAVERMARNLERADLHIEEIE